MDEGVKGVLWVFVGIGLGWLFLGGLSRMVNNMGIFVKPPSPVNTGETYGKVSFWEKFRNQENINTSISEEERIAIELKQAEEEIKKVEEALERLKEEKTVSPYKGQVEIRKCLGYKTDTDEEYIELTTTIPTGEKIQISDWTLKSEMTGTEIKIGNASKLPYTSQINTEYPVFISNKDKVIIVSGRSPIGVSFQINKCSGYLEQFQDFEPCINKECPLVKDEDLPIIGPNSFDDDCLDYIDKISRCETPLTYPFGMQYECQTYLTNEINYNSCINREKNEVDFYKPEWRIFLDRTNQLWKKDREIIKLLDAQKKVVDIYSY